MPGSHCPRNQVPVSKFVLGHRDRVFICDGSERNINGKRIMTSWGDAPYARRRSESGLDTVWIAIRTHCEKLWLRATLPYRSLTTFGPTSMAWASGISSVRAHRVARHSRKNSKSRSLCNVYLDGYASAKAPIHWHGWTVSNSGDAVANRTATVSHPEPRRRQGRT